MKWLDFLGALVLAVAVAWGFYKMAELAIIGIRAKRNRPTLLQRMDRDD